MLESAAKDTLTHEKYLHDLEHLRESFRDAIEECFKTTGADVIMARNGEEEKMFEVMSAGEAIF